MKREECNRYEMESVLRAGVTLNRRGPGDDTAQKLIGNSERRKAKRKQRAGETL
ncbi:hypothetical protein [Franconibacter helveticus]|uniref:hypothetical protein n=1 Tax=Franconibacter helveticus TaxID=357240 RepID=UPI000AF0AC57|nr:hypothetical protein [Franconibacter helveticus]